MPSRSRGWSSTERTRITLGSSLMCSSSLPPEKTPACARLRCPVRNRARNTQVYLRACSGSTPNMQLPADPLGPLAHPRQAVVASAPFIRDSRVDAASIIPDTHPQQLFAIRDFRLDPVRLRVAEGVAD